MQPAAPRGRRRSAVAAAAVGAALTLALLLLTLAPRRGHMVRLGGKDSADGDVFVPDVPGAAEARGWLLQYANERRQGGGIPHWPAAVTLPACAPADATVEERTPAAELQPRQQGERHHQQQPEQQQQRHRHLVLATVGDGWGPGESQNRWEQPPLLLHVGLAPVCLLTARGCAAGGWTIRRWLALTWW